MYARRLNVVGCGVDLAVGHAEAGAGRVCGELIGCGGRLTVQTLILSL